MEPGNTASPNNPDIDDTAALTRGASRMLRDMGYELITEFHLPDGRRADIMGLGRKGDFIIIEIKSGIADFKSDNKWTNYAGYCDRFYFAVSERFPQALIPDTVGLIIADGFGGAIIRECEEMKLAAARRKALTLRFARNAADRLNRIGGT